MKIALCNEVIRELDFARQCELARDLGYDGLEIAPFTLSDRPHELRSEERRKFRTMAEEFGLCITGLHWLLLTPPGLSVTSPDRDTRAETLEVMKGLVELCADLGGKVLIHGSPKQREIMEGDDRAEAEQRALELFRIVAGHAEQIGVVYCIEPLGQAETNYINTLEQAADLVRRVDNPAFRSMLDNKAASTSETLAVPELLDHWIPRGIIGHVHFNDQNLRGPGQGNDRFLSILKALAENGYQGAVGVEPFDYFPSGPLCAARAIGYVRGLLEAMEE